MMDFLEEAMDNRRHATLLNTENTNFSDCEFLATQNNSNIRQQQSDNKQNCGFGAEIATTMHPTKSETISTAEIFDVEVPLDVSELQMNVVDERGGGGGCGSRFGIEENKDVRTRSVEDNSSLHSNIIAEEGDEGDDDENDGDNSDDDEDDDEDTTSESDFSVISDGGSSDESGREWKPITKPINWVQKQIHSGANPRDLLSQMLPNSGPLAPGLNDMTLWRILASMLSEPPRRQKLRNINTFNDVIELVRASKNIIVLTGAGVSVSCGIPDFRSSDGIYSRLAKDFPDLPDPQAMFDINYFSRDPRPFYKFAREIYPGQFKPSPCHRFIKLLETKQKLLRNYTQNIDTLEQVAGIQNVIECHGSFSTASCTKCNFKTTADDIRADIFAQRIPVCPLCQPNVQQSSCASEPVSDVELKEIVENGIMKPDIVFFGEGLPEKFHTVMADDKDKCDLLIVIGSSLKVRPVALIPSSIPAHVPQILINREQLHHLAFDVELLGDSDVIINQLCHHLGDEWKEICFDDRVLIESKVLLSHEDICSSNEEGDDIIARLINNNSHDTQSLKSNASTDIIALNDVVGVYADSGFESSSTSSVVTVTATTHSNNKLTMETTDTEATSTTEATNSERNNTSQLAKEATAKEYNDGNFDMISPPPLLLEDNVVDVAASMSFGRSAFQPTTPYIITSDSNLRHLSIDSSKDSGIQCGDSSSSNSIAASLLQSPLNNKFTNDVDRAEKSLQNTIQIAASSNNDETNTKEDLLLNATTATPTIAAAAETATTTYTNEHKFKQRRPQKYLSAAERLTEGTYYWHESSASYVFPGAQVSWNSDVDEYDDDDDVEDLEGQKLEAPALMETKEGITKSNNNSSHKYTLNISTTSEKRQYEHVVGKEEEEKEKCTQKLPKNSNTATVVADLSAALPPVKRRCTTLDVAVNNVVETLAATHTTLTTTAAATKPSNTTPISNSLECTVHTNAITTWTT